MLKEIEELFEAHMKIFERKVEGNKPENGQNPMIFFYSSGLSIKGGWGGTPPDSKFSGPHPMPNSVWIAL